MASKSSLLVWTAALLHAVHASPNVISDSRIRDPGLTPRLGRGFSTSTSEVLSTCVTYDEVTEPTYNYAYNMLEVTSDGTVTSSSEGEMKASISWGFISASVAGKMKSSKTKKTKKHLIVTTMSMERYYASVKDTTMELTPDAKSLIDKGDIVGFFGSCGSGYIRSMRRTAEMTAVFEFSSTSEASLKKLSGSVKVKLFGRKGGGGSFSSEQENTATDTSMKITIKAFGLGLNLEGADTLVARSLEDYDAAMKFAFKSMQNVEVGMVHGIEVLNWANTLAFQNAINFAAIPEEIETVPEGTRDTEDKEIEPVVAKEVAAIEVKSITMINAEFITILESFYRQQLQYYYKLRMCMGNLKLMAKRTEWKDRQLIDHTSMSTKALNEGSITLGELHDFMTTPNDALETQLKTLTGFVSRIYAPCATALQKSSNKGRMTKYWFDLPICEAASACLEPGKTFSRDNPGCEAAVPDDKGIGYSLDNIIDKYCLPELVPNDVEVAHKTDDK